MLRFLPLFVVLSLIVTFIALNSYLPLKRELAYKFGFSGDPTTSCCPEPDPSRDLGEFDETANLAVFDNQLIDYPKTSLAQVNNNSQDSQVLGTMTASGVEKWIEVSLREQKVRAWEGDNIVKEFSVSSGKWNRTPKGTYHIWYKTRSQTMKGGSKELGTYYNLPNVPFNMFFYKGYALHGAYWHNNFGTPMSHGCVNEPIADAEWMFNWAGPVVPEGKNVIKASAENPGTKVFIH